ncbi:MAG: hypothetical protein GTO40_27915 [Deltaproteobacteria bacterium]|nr:hypothetical protein [Deltaproteobacteria bacterium]
MIDPKKEIFGKGVLSKIMLTNWRATSFLGLLFATFLLAGCESGGSENQVRDAVEEVVTKDFKIYESTKETIANIQKTSDEERQQQLDMLK